MYLTFYAFLAPQTKSYNLLNFVHLTIYFILGFVLRYLSFLLLSIQVNLSDTWGSCCKTVWERELSSINLLLYETMWTIFCIFPVFWHTQRNHKVLQNEYMFLSRIPCKPATSKLNNVSNCIKQVLSFHSNITSTLVNSVCTISCWYSKRNYANLILKILLLKLVRNYQKFNKLY